MASALHLRWRLLLVLACTASQAPRLALSLELPGMAQQQVVQPPSGMIPGVQLVPQQMAPPGIAPALTPQQMAPLVAAVAAAAVPLEVAPPPGEATLTVSERLAMDSSHTGLVAKNLLEVQGRIESVEREVLGKAFDIETLRNFLGSHRQAMDSSTSLQGNISAASAKVDALTAQLQSVRQSISENEFRHLKRMAELRALLARGEAEIERIGQATPAKAVFPAPAPATAPAVAPATVIAIAPATVAVPAPAPAAVALAAPQTAPAPAPAEKKLENQERDLEQVDAGLEKTNKALRGQSASEAAAASTTMGDLQAAHAELARRQREVSDLEAEILKQHQYSDDCHQRAEALRQQLAAEERRLSAGRDRIAEVEHQRIDAQEALIQDNRQLQARLVKSKANLATIQTQVVSTKDRHTALQAEGEVQFGLLRKTLGVRRQEADAAEIELTARLNATRNAEQKLKQSQAEVGRLQGILLGGRLAEMRRNNTQLKTDLKQTHYTLQESNSALVTFATKMAEANETLQILRIAATESAENARTAARDSLARVAEAKRRDDEATAKAEDATMEAEASALTDCVATWDKMHKGVFVKLDACEQVKRDLQSKNAQVATLSSTVQGNEMRNNVSAPE